MLRTGPLEKVLKQRLHFSGVPRHHCETTPANGAARTGQSGLTGPSPVAAVLARANSLSPDVAGAQSWDPTGLMSSISEMMKR